MVATNDALTGELVRAFAFLLHSGQDNPFQVAAELELSTSQLRLLFLLSQDGEQPLHALQQRVGLSVAATGRAVDALVRDGLATRREDEQDRRVKRIALAERGREVVERFAQARRSGFAEVVATLEEEERAALSAGLAPILARAAAAPAPHCTPAKDPT